MHVTAPRRMPSSSWDTHSSVELIPGRILGSEQQILGSSAVGDASWITGGQQEGSTPFAW